MQFSPSRFATPVYGFHEDPGYYSQIMLRGLHSPGSYGAYGNYGISEGAGLALNAGVGLTTGLVGLALQQSAAKKEREHALAMAKEEAEVLRLQAELGLLAPEESGWGWIIFGLVAVGLTAGGGYWYWQKKKTNPDFAFFGGS